MNQKSGSDRLTTWLTGLCVGVAIVFAGCPDQTSEKGPLEAAGETVDEALEDAGEAVEDAVSEEQGPAEEAGEMVDEAVEDAASAVEETAADVQETADGQEPK